jgi:diguanylate cyclase (GGDEF)-like protein/PAS domain S-box-containing protein
MNEQQRLTITPAPPPAEAVRRSLFPDYTHAAIVYWLVLAVAGAAALGYAAVELTLLSASQLWQVMAITVVAAIVGMFPLRIPKSKNSIAAGDIFIFLLLLLHGPAAAAIAAAAEAAVCVWRTSTRWSSRIASPAAAAVAMFVCGSGFELGTAALASAGISGDGAMFGALMIFAGAYFIASPTLVTAVIYLKRRHWPTLAEWLNDYAWLGMGYLASASVAGVLYLAFRQFGISTILVAAPMIAMFLTTVHYYFAQQEAAEREALERASRERAEAAQREAAQAAQHLRELEQSDRRFHSAFTHAAIGMALVSDEGRVVQANRAMCALLGHEREAIIGAEFSGFVEPADAEVLAQQLRQVRMRETESFRVELRCRHPEGREVWASMHCSYFADASATGSHLIFQAFDVTARRVAEGRLQHLAYHDSLTNLANRSRLHEAVAQAIEANRADPAHQFSVMHLNFDRFKLLNDSLGHGAGDLFLVKVARRLREHVRPSDIVARLGGDEFAILTVHRGRGTHHAITLAERLQEAFRTPIVVNDTEVNTGISIGITFSDVGYQSADEALRDADLAMSKAKANGKARHALFDPSLHERATERLLLEMDLRRGLDANQLTLVFQPVFELEPQRLVGFEALARWEHPERGPIPPATFIPVAEESGLIGQLTQWAIQRACLQLRAWRDRFPSYKELFVNVNISGHDLCEPKFTDQVRETLAQFGLPPTCLTLEITENTLMQQLDMGGKTLAQLRELGVGLSVDDFGTGYSSLSHLSTLPISSLKIDRSFVSKLDSSESDETEIVRAVIQLGDALGKRVIAEGIETAAQLARLRDFRCGFGQGFLMARPLTVHQIAALLGGAPVAEEPAPVAEASTTAAELVVELPLRIRA